MKLLIVKYETVNIYFYTHTLSTTLTLYQPTTHQPIEIQYLRALKTSYIYTKYVYINDALITACSVHQLPTISYQRIILNLKIIFIFEFKINLKYLINCF